ncbi:MAG: efflux RND transporter permease subunit [Cyclobacteriaceae bacterium]|nr:efflux RND transporter permease subunit [Cyclobacteriaceae bacterium]MCH8517673.1 efflux RND transporter permease subunit [Cyclobacteriaceae bacterium]
MQDSFFGFFLKNKIITYFLLVILLGWGVWVAPFDFGLNPDDKNPVPVDAIPDTGDNQQIVFTEWQGRSPQDVEDQITYPLTTNLMGLPGVRSVRSNSMFGFSSINIIFEDGVDYYWSRTRILEKLNSLPSNLLPDGVSPNLGPDATSVGQVFWYTIEGRDKQGNPTGGWDIHELRRIQDFYLKYGLSAVSGVAEVASVGGMVQEYQVEVNPDALVHYGLSFDDVVVAVGAANREVGAGTFELSKAEYFIRGLGYVKQLEDIEEAVVDYRDEVAIRVKDVAWVQWGPKERRGILDKGGAEVVGGVVTSRFGENPMQVIANVKKEIKDLEKGLPSKTLADGTESQLKVIPFYDRSVLIQETLGTLEDALIQQVLIAALVIIILVFNLKASLTISVLLPLAVLFSFICMKYVGVDANIVALSGIAIAIGTMVDIGIILSENILIQLEEQKNKLKAVLDGVKEVAGAIFTAVSTTIISFIPVFTLQAAEGKLFTPLAYTKTFALIGALVVAFIFLPTILHSLLNFSLRRKQVAFTWNSLLLIVGIYLATLPLSLFPGILVAVYAVYQLLLVFEILPAKYNHYLAEVVLVGMLALYWLSEQWMPLGVQFSIFSNLTFVAGLAAFFLISFFLIIRFYENILRLCLRYKAIFLSIPILTIFLACNVWFGFKFFAEPIAKMGDKAALDLRETSLWTSLNEAFPGLNKEFMPALDEGSFLLMPVYTPAAGVEVSHAMLRNMDMAVAAIPEVEDVVGKIGRAESPLDPAPLSMFENVVTYKSEFITDESGRILRFKVDKEGEFARDEDDTLIPDPRGKPYRQWRDHINSPDDIWNEISDVTALAGITVSPKLQPIETRSIMLQTGMRAPMGVIVSGPDLYTIEEFSSILEGKLKQVSGVKPAAVFADRVVGKPYLELHPKREVLKDYGISLAQLNNYIEAAVGGMVVGQTVAGRERFDLRVRLARDFRNQPEELKQLPIKVADGKEVPLGMLVDLELTAGPMSIKSENSFQVAYVLFDREQGQSEIAVVERARDFLDKAIARGELKVPEGVSYRFAGNFENQQRAEKRLMIVIPLCLLAIFMILYLQFRRVSTVLMVFSGIATAFSGGFLLIGMYNSGNFLDISLLGRSLSDIFQVHDINLSVAVWVGFIALFGIATDDGVVMATYLDQSFRKRSTESRSEIREAVIAAGKKRIRPCMMTTATTVLALLPVLSSAGRGADIMIPMAIPAFGGMLMAIVTVFVIPVLYAWKKEHELKVKTDQ